MSLTEKKITVWTNPVSAEADRPERSAAEMKAIFDSNSNQLKTAFNGAVDELVSPSGAEQVGAADFGGLHAENVQQALLALKEYTDELAIGAGAMVSVNGQTGKNIQLDYEDVGAAPPPVVFALSLPMGGWQGDAAPYTQTVEASAVTPGAVVDVAAAPDSFLPYCAAQVRAVAQGEGSLTFACEELPEADLTVNVKVL